MSLTKRELRSRAAARVGQTWTSPAGRHIRCQFCGETRTVPRKNGAWWKLKGILREHIEKHHAAELARDREVTS